MSGKSRWKAMLGVALTWGVAWGIVTASTQAFFMLRFYLKYHNTGTYYYSSIVGQGMAGLIMGALAGVLFTTLFARIERGRTVGTLAWSRIAVLGGVSGLLFLILPVALALVTGHALSMDYLIYGAYWSLPLGIASAAITLGIARRGELPSGEEPYGAFPVSDAPAGSLTK